jgi:hypothetical protein
LELGSLLPKKEGMILPPPSWAFGVHFPIPDDLSPIVDLKQQITLAREGYKLPFEGLFLREKDLVNDMSYTLNEAMFSKDQLQFYSSQNLSIIAVSTSGYDLEGQFPGDTRLKMIQDKSL